MKRKAFTLIELLVVIGIIAILAALLFPVFARVKEQARSNNCRANLKQLALALQTYRDDNEGLFPISTYLYDEVAATWSKHSYWPEQLMGVQQLKGGTFKCLSDAGLKDLSYNVNRFLFGFFNCRGPAGGGHVSQPPQSPATFKNINLPTKIITILDGENTDLSDPQPAGIDDVWSRRTGWFAYAAPKGTADKRHLGKANYAFVDGHIESLSPDSIGRDSQGGGGSSLQGAGILLRGGACTPCGHKDPGVTDTEPWWGPGMVAAAAKAGIDFKWITSPTCAPYTGIGSWPFQQNVWNQYGENTFCYAERSAQALAPSLGKPPEWFFGLDPTDLGPGPGGHRWNAAGAAWPEVLDHAFGLYRYGTMPTFNVGF